MSLNRIILLVIIFFTFSCKKGNIKKGNIHKHNKKEVVNGDLIDKKSFIGSKWREINYENNTFKLSSVKEEWQSYVEILNENESIIYLMEPTKYDLDSIQVTDNSLLLHIKSGGWFYKFKWIDKNRYIGRWDYIYNKTVIDSSFSMYVIDEKHMDILNKK